MKAGIRLILSATLAAVLNLNAAQDALPTARNTTNPAQTKTSNQADTQATPQMQEMAAMAKSMTSMADACRIMMEKEMRNRPLKVAALSVIGVVGLAALSLFVVLEIQWIRFWSIRIKTEKLKLTSPKSS